MFDIARLRPREAPCRAPGNYRTIPAGEVLEVMDVTGCGCIRHIWITLPAADGYEENAPPPANLRYKMLVLRMYWDFEETPSVEVPIGDFFCQGFGKRYPLNSQLVAIGGKSTGLNCYFPMPFATHARIEVANEGSEDLEGFYHYIDYVTFDELNAVDGLGRFHAQYRQQVPVHPGNYVFFEAEGRGVFTGLNVQTHAQSGGWWGEGGDFFRIDGAADWSLVGTGSEDYFCNGWGFEEGQSLPYFGSPYFTLRYGRSLLYRWHEPDPIAFQESCHGEIQHHGHLWASRKAEIAGEKMSHSSSERLGDNYYSVAYWYQEEPHAAFPVLAPLEARMPLPVFHPKKNEIVLDEEDVRLVLLEEGEEKTPVLAMWQLYGRPKRLALPWPECPLKPRNAFHAPREAQVEQGNAVFSLSTGATYVPAPGISTEALRQAAEQAKLV